jgi:hypothetical protein
MAHDNNKNYKAVNAISKAINKKGKIKGKNKKETKFLLRACAHHRINRKGKLKPAFINNSNGKCVCELCGQSFPTKPATKAEIREMIQPVMESLNQATAVVVAGNLGDKAANRFVELKVALAEFPKYYSRTMKAISKADNIKKKKKNNGGDNGGGSSQYGGWSRK